MSRVQTLAITLKRPLRSITVGDHAVTTEAPRNDAAEGRAAFPDQASINTATAESASRLSEPARARSTSVATVITNPSDRVMTPLSQSLAVPVLSPVTHAALPVEGHGLIGIDPENIRELKSLLGDAVDAVVQLSEQHRQSLSELQEVAVELASAAASWLVGFAIERDLFAIDELILNALQHMEPDQPVRVRLNPDDHRLLCRLMHDRSSADLLHQISFEEAPELARGTCRVESGRRVLLSDLNSRMEDIRRSWRETLDDSQVERRENDSAPGTLRRFPDRRETA